VGGLARYATLAPKRTSSAGIVYLLSNSGTLSSMGFWNTKGFRKGYEAAEKDLKP
jgi:hypothetical protein